MAFFCGTGSFSHVDDNDPWQPSTPRGSSRRKHSSDGNPYSTRGLDKFSMVLADLEARREKIMEAMGSQGASIVHFVYSNTDDWVPVVVRPRDPPPEDKPKKGRGAQTQNRQASAEEPPALPPPPAEQLTSSADGFGPDEPVPARTVRKAGNGEGGGLWLPSRYWKPSYYLPVAVVLILLCLAVFGRAFAICCTSVWWYTVPAMSGREGLHVGTSTKRKDYVRRASDKRLGAAAGGGDAASRKAGGLDGLASPRRHHRNGKRGPP